MGEITLDYLRKLYSQISKLDLEEDELNEETVKISIVVNFLKMLGYKEEWFHYEHPTYEKKRRVDVSIFINGNKSNMFFVEVKRPTDILDGDSQTQIMNYINDKGIQWGMLTNGCCYILFNNDIKGRSENKEVLRYYLNTPTKKQLDGYKFYKPWNDNNLKFFSYDFLYNKCVTNYLRYTSEYIKTIKSPTSIRQYKSTLYNFINYISEKFNTYDMGFINKYNFNQFVLIDINSKQSTSKPTTREQTIINKYAHIRGFCGFLKDRNVIVNNQFEKMTKEEMFKDIDFNNTSNFYVPLSHEEILNLLESYDGTLNSLRNKITLLLFLYLGLDIKDVKNLRNDDINVEKNTIVINGRTLPIPSKLTAMIDEFKNFKKQNKIKCDFLICGYYEGSYRELNDTNFNDIITQQFEKLDIRKNRHNKLTTSFIKSCVIKGLYMNGVRIEEIAKFTGLSLYTIDKYLSDEDSYKKMNYKNVISKHPYRDLFDNL